MSKVVSFPQARIPLGWALVQGERVPVEIDQEWMRSFMALLDRTGGTSGDASFDQYIPMFFETPHTDATAHEAMGMIDELRNEFAMAKTEQQALRTMLDDLAVLLQGGTSTDLRNRIEQIEDRLT
jgi:hypothetical protein